MSELTEIFLPYVSMEFKEEVLRRKYEEETGSMAEEKAQQEAEEHRALMAWNKEENLRLLALRWEEIQNYSMMKNMKHI